VAADGASTTSYSYQGNTVTVTDPAGKWKKYATNVLGQLIPVNEPNPAGGSDYVTTYTYDLLGHLAGVSMPRSSGTQTRTFNYGTPPGNLLQSATNPENGTVSYTYNSYNKIATKADAKGQQTQYSYDSYQRLTQVRHYISGSEDTCQRVDYYYDSDFGTGFSSNVSGRLAPVQYKNVTTTPGICDTTFTEMYSYNSGGARTKKRFRTARSGVAVPSDLDSSYTYDNEGRMTDQYYPNAWALDGSGNPTVSVTGAHLTNTYDSMGRLATLTENGSTNVISSTTYGPAGELQAMSGSWGSEARSYNAMLQMTALSSGSLSLAYNYSSTQNNGKITSQHDYVSGEDISYTYDSLNRLATAQTADPTWGQSYAYDGFGNLTDITTTKGTPRELHVGYSASTNRQSGDSADANGNIGAGAYDVENRMIRSDSIGTARYAYAPDNKRVWRGVWSSGTQTVDELTYWSVTGQRVASYAVKIYGATVYAVQTGTEYYFGGKLVKNAGGYVHADRLGSIGKYYPYGQDRTAPGNGTEKFGTYFRDSDTGLDYADQRYHAPGQGRFLSSDPYRGDSGGAGDVTARASWNRYAYVQGDPINSGDPTGQMEVCVDGICDDSSYTCAGSDQTAFLPTDGDESDPTNCAPSPFQTVARKKPKKPANPCDIFKDQVGFLRKHFADAAALADDLDVPVDFVLSVSAAESLWGTSRIAVQGNNFFGIHAGPIAVANGATGSMPTNGAPVVTWSATAGYIGSGGAFEDYAVNDGATGVTNSTNFFTRIHKQFGVGTFDYVTTMNSVLKLVDILLACP